MNKRITKVTTKTGDKGTTGMADGSRVSKADPIINSIGEIDELNSLIGYLDSLPDSEDYRYVLRRIQNCLSILAVHCLLVVKTLLQKKKYCFLKNKYKS